MADRKYERVLLKISGEGLCRKGGFGIDGEQLDKIAGELKSVVETGVQLALVVGAERVDSASTANSSTRSPANSNR